MDGRANPLMDRKVVAQRSSDPPREARSAVRTTPSDSYKICTFLPMSCAFWLRSISHLPIDGSDSSTLRVHTAVEKNTVLCDFSTFSRACIFSSDFFSSLTFNLLPFSSRALPTSALPSVHIVGSLTCNLPSTICLIASNIRPVLITLILLHALSWFGD